MLKLNIFYLRERFRYPLTLITRRDKSITEISAENSYVPLKRGDVVKVKPFKEIQQTLDEKGFYKGMLFINEMVQYCGGTYKVFKRVNKVFIPRHGKMSKCRETVLLDGVFCNGYGPDIYCTRTCFFFWKEAWLEKIE